MVRRQYPFSASSLLMKWKGAGGLARVSELESSDAQARLCVFKKDGLPCTRLAQFLGF